MKELILKFWEIYLIAIGIGLIVSALTILSNNPWNLLRAGFIILAVGALIMAFNSTKQNKKSKK